ncbi:MAG TPA: long-chain fatty acid--CoA ligase [Spirochaetota bacterium]|nr:long-chain fatty acid--CoA ligase [Spirochaetota bacterium]OPZ39149.1 MAG: Long-chain-fatty-acid--CoA ligase FadD15 [Spirochaetes bacterium ADurb.BinA120]HNU92141.1 long-chain fatty acid--CoA ligase [Spirochaetota bacterium]HPI14136.1 long-chain fatty acid--CoA ligase [Spirochaetota bacterium]HPO44815.1 long-chain fatty acid--CoA ligase [Spirochaetota bacterium]
MPVDYSKEFDRFLEREKHLGLMVRSRVKKYGDRKVAVRHKPHGEWISYTWAKFGSMIESTAKGLLALGAKENEMVGIFAANSAWWAVADYACFSIRACSVPVYATNSARELEYIVNDAGIRFLFVGNQEQYEKALEIKKNSKVLKKIIVFDPKAAIGADEDVMYLEDFMETGANAGKEADLESRVAKLDSEDLSTLIYTSGTTGEPKGVMLTHKNWLAMLFATGYHIPIVESDVNLAFLPLSHVFERAWSYFILCGNGRVDYCHDTKAIMEFLKESRPHYMCSVPRMWEKVYAMVKDGMANAPEKKRKIFNWALAIGGEYQGRKRDKRFIGPWLGFRHAVAYALVLKKIKSIFGGRNKVFNCGGSAFSGEIAEFFFKAGVLLLQGYGLTECFVISVANPEHNKFGTCGPVVPLMQVRISPEGEIQAKSPSMMKGYWNKPELSKEMFTEDGWIKTGDVGFIDEEGYVTITDRIKELFKTSGGKYISPQQIETLLKEDIYFEQVAAIGDQRKFVSALIVPGFEPLVNWAKKNDIRFSSREELLKHPEVQKLYREKIDYYTRDLGQVEKIKKFTLLPKEFTQEDGEITATQKIKRKVINQRYKDIIDAMYAE